MSKKTISGQHNGFEFVEIAGIKWATCNVGAEKPTDTGLYFQWGDRKGYIADEVGKTKIFDWWHYKHFNGKRLTKYNESDNKYVLDLYDDAAFAYMGHGWRMPTQDDFRCLFESAIHRWTSNYQNSGVAGTVFTDRTDESKELFFPVTVYCHGGAVESVGDVGFYWSSSHCSDDVFYAYRLVFGNDFVYWGGYSSRYQGFPIRGILTV